MSLFVLPILTQHFPILFSACSSFFIFLGMAEKSFFNKCLLNIGCDSSHINNNLILVLVFGKNAKNKRLRFGGRVKGEGKVFSFFVSKLVKYGPLSPIFG